MKNVIHPAIEEIVGPVENKIIVNQRELVNPREVVNLIKIVKKRIENAEMVKTVKTVKMG
jgi:DNA polymerase II large subunit